MNTAYKNLPIFKKAEEMLRQLRKESPDEFERIANLRDGIRTAKSSRERGLFVFCEADRYQQLFLLDEDGKIISRDVPRILGGLKCAPDVKGAALPKEYNASVMRVKCMFSEEVKHRQAEKEYTLSLSHGQRYVLRELRVLFGVSRDEDEKTQINVLEKAFRGTLSPAVKKELNLLRRNGVAGYNLLKSLTNLYHQHGMKDWMDRKLLQSEELPIPKIVCSEGLV